MKQEDFVLDVTLDGGGLNCYCPYLKDTEEVVFGLSILTDRCPGNLVGVVHMDGNEAVEKWIAEHPEYPERYKNAEQ